MSGSGWEESRLSHSYFDFLPLVATGAAVGIGTGRFDFIGTNPRRGFAGVALRWRGGRHHSLFLLDGLLA
jgi:hypothetical protein